MSVPPLLAVNDAFLEDSIWQNFGEKNFRENVTQLQQVSNGIPGDPQVYPLDDWHGRTAGNAHVQYRLPLAAEQRIADDIAYLLAKKDVGKTVSACALEQHTGVEGLTVRIAVNNGVDKSSVNLLRSLFQIVKRCAAGSLLPKQCAEQIFKLVIKSNRACLHSRILSKHHVPTQRKRIVPLGSKIEQFKGILSKNCDQAALNKKLEGLSAVLNAIDKCSTRSERELRLLSDLVKLSYELCTPDGKPLEETLRTYGLDPEICLENSALKQINKVGRYWGLCVDLARAASRYRDLFRTIDFQSIPRYERYTSKSLLAVGEKNTYYVHAEIQLLLFYDLHPSPKSLKPRVLGVSKAACYLCNLFINEHRQFCITKTHGKLYHQWNFPNVKAYSTTQRQQYRRILTKMNSELVQAVAKETKRKKKRPDPMESYVQLPLRFLPSATASEAGTMTSRMSRQGHLDPTQDLSVPCPVPVHTESHERGELSVAVDPIDGPCLQASELLRVKSDTQLPHPTVSLPLTVSGSRSSLTKPQANKIVALDLNGSAQSKVSINHNLPAPHQDSQAPPAPQTSPSSSLARSISSSRTFLRPETPKVKEITATRPFHVRMDNLHLIFEIDPPARGLVQVSAVVNENEREAKDGRLKLDRDKRELKRHQNGEDGYMEGEGPWDKHWQSISSQPGAIDIASLRTDHALEFSSQDQDGSNITVLNLRQPPGRLIQIRLQWL